jgi:guanyl-specific ribonuclease Sa
MQSKILWVSVICLSSVYAGEHHHHHHHHHHHDETSEQTKTDPRYASFKVALNNWASTHPKKQGIRDALLAIMEEHFVQGHASNFPAFIHFLNNPSGYTINGKFYTGRDIYFYFPGLTQEDIEVICFGLMTPEEMPKADRLDIDFYRFYNSNIHDFKELAKSWGDGRHISLDIVEGGWQLNRQWGWDKFSNDERRSFQYCTGWLPRPNSFAVFEADMLYYKKYGFYGDEKAAPEGDQQTILQQVFEKMWSFALTGRPFFEFQKYLIQNPDGAKNLYFAYPGIAFDSVMSVCQSAGIPMIYPDQMDQFLSWLVTLSNGGPGGLTNPTDREVFKAIAEAVQDNEAITIEELEMAMCKLTEDGQELLLWCLNPLDPDGTPPIYDEDGSVFDNKEKLLPANDAYTEHVHPMPGGGPQSARLILGKSGKVYFTFDHYRSFLRVDQFMAYLPNPGDQLTQMQVVAVLMDLHTQDPNFNKNLQNLEKITGIDLSLYNSGSFHLTPEQLSALTMLMKNFQNEISVAQVISSMLNG